MSDNNKYTAASVSNADKVIDALQEVRAAEVKPSYCCADCGSTAFTVRSPLGGHKIKVCANCGSKLYAARANINPLMPSNINHDQGTGRGPTKQPIKPKPTKNQPTYRNKGKKR